MRSGILAGALLAALFVADGAVLADTFTRIGKFRVGGPLIVQEVELTHDVQYTTGIRQYWIIKVQGTRAAQAFEYCIVFGPEPTKDDEGGTMTIKDSVQYPANQELSVISGAAYYAGTYPYGGTQGGSGAGEGTIFMTYGRNRGSSLDDVFIYFNDGTTGGIDVYKKGDPDPAKSRDITLVNHYLLVPDNGDMTNKSQQPLNTGPQYIQDAALWMISRAAEAKMLLDKAGLTCPGLDTPNLFEP